MGKIIKGNLEETLELFDSRINNEVDEELTCEEQRNLIKDIVVEVTNLDELDDEKEINMLVDALCEKYDLGVNYDFSDYDKYEMSDWIEAHDEITPEVFEDALNNFEKLSRFDYDPSEFENRMYELAEDYDVDVDLVAEYLE